VWSTNAAGNYGFPREAAVKTPLGAQTGSITLGVAALTATVATQPANVTLAATNVAYDSANSRLTFDLSATNHTAGQLYNVKSVFGVPSVGTIGNATATSDAGDPSVILGFAATLPAGTATNTITIDGVGAADTVTLPLTIAEGAMTYLGATLLDPAGGNVRVQVPAIRSTNNASSMFTSGGASPSGRYIYGLTRWSAGFFRIDTTSGDVAAVSPVTHPTANGACVVFPSDGYAYALFGLGAHRRSTNSNGFALAKIDPATMTVIATAELFPDDNGRVRGCALHGTTLAFGMGTTAYFADLAAMAFIDKDPSSANVVDGIVMNTVNGNALMHFAYKADGTTLYASTIRGAEIFALDTAAGTVSTYHTAPNTNVYALQIDAANKLWWGDGTTMYSFDGTTETAVPNLTNGVRSFGAFTGTKVFATDNASSFTLDTADGTRTEIHAIDANRNGHWQIVVAQ